MLEWRRVFADPESEVWNRVILNGLLDTRKILAQRHRGFTIAELMLSQSSGCENGCNRTTKLAQDFDELDQINGFGVIDTQVAPTLQ